MNIFKACSNNVVFFELRLLEDAQEFHTDNEPFSSLPLLHLRDGSAVLPHPHFMIPVLLCEPFTPYKGSWTWVLQLG